MKLPILIILFWFAHGSVHPTIIIKRISFTLSFLDAVSFIHEWKWNDDVMKRWDESYSPERKYEKWAFSSVLFFFPHFRCSNTGARKYYLSHSFLDLDLLSVLWRLRTTQIFNLSNEFVWWAGKSISKWITRKPIPWYLKYWHDELLSSTVDVC